LDFDLFPSQRKRYSVVNYTTCVNICILRHQDGCVWVDLASDLLGFPKNLSFKVTREQPLEVTLFEVVTYLHEYQEEQDWDDHGE
jgi:hypothetical protein